MFSFRIAKNACLCFVANKRIPHDNTIGSVYRKDIFALKVGHRGLSLLRNGDRTELNRIAVVVCHASLKCEGLGFDAKDGEEEG